MIEAQQQIIDQHCETNRRQDERIAILETETARIQLQGL